MFKMFKQAGVWLAMVAVIAIIGIFSFLQIGVKNNIKLHQVPVALVNEDSGQTSMKLVKQLKKKFAGHDAQIKWVVVKHQKDLKQGFNDKKYYGALIIDHDFSQQLGQSQNYLKALVTKDKLTAMVQKNAALTTSLSPQIKAAEAQLAQTPTSAKMTVIVNQGMNATVAQALTTALPAMGNAMNQKISQQEKTVLQQNDVSLSATSWQTISNPIKVTQKTVNKIPSKSVSGAAPMLTIVFAWLGSLIGSMLLWRVYHKNKPNGRWTIKHITSQLLAGAVMSVVVALSFYFFAHTCFAMAVPDASEFIWILMGNVFVFFLLQTCILDWAGFKGWPLIIVLWLCAAAVLAYAPEIMPALYRNWIYSWIPMRFSADMITNALYFTNGSSTTMSSAWVIGIIGVVALILIYLLPLKKDRQGILK